MKTKWQDLIIDLKESGMSYAYICHECGCARSTLSDLVTGRTRVPSLEYGMELLRLHKIAKRRLARRAA